MTLIVIPAGARFSSVKWSCDFTNQRNRSRWTGTSKVIGLPGVEKWYATGVLRPQAREVDVRKWRAFTMNLRGSENEFRLPMCINQTTSNPTVASSAGVNALNLNSTAMLAIGMGVTIPLPSGHQRLAIITGIAGVQIAFQPALPETPVVGAVIEAMNPYGLMSLVEPRQGWDDADGLAGFTFDAEEAI